MGNKSFHDELKKLMDDYVDSVYNCTHKFPKEEIYGVTSQLRRSTLSIVLNYIEGYARQRKKVTKNFLEISYGSLKESRYLVYFSCKRRYISKDEHDELIKMADRIGAMLWGTISKI